VRRETLASLLRKARPGIVLSEHLDGDGEAMLRRACALARAHHGPPQRGRGTSDSPGRSPATRPGAWQRGSSRVDGARTGSAARRSSSH